MENPHYAYAAAPVPVVLSLPELSDTIALEYGIPTSTLRNLVWSESRWNPDAMGDEDRSCGLVQIFLPDNPGITCDQAKDPEFALRFAAQKLAAGQEWRWTVCSCVSYAHTRIRGLPRGDADIYKPNTTPQVGALALFRYGDIAHVAVIREIHADYFLVGEANFTPCLVGTRKVLWTDPALKGFYK